LREKESESKIIDNRKLTDYVRKNGYKMEKSFLQYGDYSEVKLFTNPEDHQIYPQFGARVLSVSKVMHGIQVFTQSNIQEKIKSVAAGHPIPTDPKEICRWTVEVAKKNKKGQPIIEWYSSYTDTDSYQVPTSCLPFLKYSIGENLGELHSDFDFPGELLPVYTAFSENQKSKFKTAYDMKLSAIEGYYCDPKSYACKVFGIYDGKYKIMDHIRLKGVFKGLAEYEHLEKLYNGEPLKFIDDSGIHFLHVRGKGLGCQQDDICKEILPERVDNTKYYYAVGDNIHNGHYKFGEKPITKHSMIQYRYNPKIRYYIYKPDGVTREEVSAEVCTN
jgi:hypothetical protein